MTDINNQVEYFIKIVETNKFYNLIAFANYNRISFYGTPTKESSESQAIIIDIIYFLCHNSSQ